jgi:Glycosyltransferase sugar-binding region containing DXD motif
MYVHRYWSGPAELPESSALAAAIIKKNFPRAYLLDWTDSRLPNTILMEVEKRIRFVPAYDRVIHRANLVRLLLLEEFGGAWIDHDFILMRPPRELEIAAHPNGSYCPCYMSFPAEHPEIVKAIATIEPAPNATYSSGSRHLNKVLDPSLVKTVLPFGHTGEELGTLNEQTFVGVHLSYKP